MSSVLFYTKLNSLSFSQTSFNIIQEIIRERVEKWTKGVHVPIGGKKMITFIDNVPAKDQYGSHSPLELIRLWLLVRPQEADKK